MSMSLGKRMGAELIGTFWLVLGGCGSAVLAASSPLGIGVLGEYLGRTYIESKRRPVFLVRRVYDPKD